VSDEQPCYVLPDTLHPAAFLLDAEIRAPDFIVKPFFPRGELTEIVGAHGNFKSTIALDACLCVASGHPWGGVQSIQGRSVFITLEDSADTLARRLKAWLEGVHQNAAEEDVRQNFRFLTREDSQGLVLTRTQEGATTARLDVAERVSDLTRGASLIVLETASRLHDGPETNDAFAAFVRSLERIATAGAALVIVRHMSKKAAREMLTSGEVDSYAGRGGGALSDAARSVLVVTRGRGGDSLAPVTLTAAKTTHAKSGDTVSWVPIVVPQLECVRLEAQTAESREADDAEMLLAHLAANETGIVHSQLHKNPPSGLGRARTMEALRLLLAHGRVVERQEQRGRSRQRATVYYTPRPGLEAR
jgi:RecA-family ATPase